MHAHAYRFEFLTIVSEQVAELFLSDDSFDEGDNKKMLDRKGSTKACDKADVESTAQ